MRLPLALFAAVSLLSAAPALAQGPAAMAPDSMHHGRGGPPEGRRADMKARMEAHRQQATADFTTILRLKPSQQAALTSWLEATRPMWGERGRMGMDRSMTPGTETTAQRLDQEQARMSEREARMKTRLDATRRFYASLAPDQQQVFDALQRLHHGGMGRGGMGRRGGMGMGRGPMMGPGPMGSPPPRG